MPQAGGAVARRDGLSGDLLAPYAIPRRSAAARDCRRRRRGRGRLGAARSRRGVLRRRRDASCSFAPSSSRPDRFSTCATRSSRWRVAAGAPRHRQRSRRSRRLAGAAGVHVGQDDLAPAAAARPTRVRPRSSALDAHARAGGRPRGRAGHLHGGRTGLRHAHEGHRLRARSASSSCARPAPRRGAVQSWPSAASRSRTRAVGARGRRDGGGGDQRSARGRRPGGASRQL